MAMVKWSAFYPYVAPDVYECPELTMEIAVRDSAIEFCRRTFVWKEQLDTIMSIKGIATYDIEIPNGTVCENVIDVIHSGKRLAPVKFEDLPTNRDTSRAKPLAYSLIFGDQLRLYPTPDENGKLDITVSLTPSSTATSIDSSLFERYKEIIAHGAKHRLMTVPSKSWSNPALAQYHMTQFMRGVGEARIRTDNDQSHVVYNRRFV
jgi:hypothetical protein